MLGAKARLSLNEILHTHSVEGFEFDEARAFCPSDANLSAIEEVGFGVRDVWD